MQRATLELSQAASGRRAVRVLLLVLLPVLVFSNALKNDYQLDDIYRIRENHEIERVSPIGRHFFDPRTSATLPQLVQYRPLLPLTLSLSAAAGDALGLDRRVAHRLGNLALHIATGLLLAALFAELLRYAPAAVQARRKELGFAAALLFAVHPVAGVPVNYLCARDLLLMHFFLAAALLVYARMCRLRGDSFAGWAAVIVLLSLSILSKTDAAIAFALVLAFELVCARTRWSDWRLWARTAAAGSVAAAFVLWTRHLGFSDLDQLRVTRSSALEYPLTELKVHVFYYLRNAVWPFELRAVPDIAPVTSLLDWRALVGAAVVGGSLIAAWRLRAKNPAVAFAILAYWLLLAITSSVIPLRSVATDYRQVPSLGFLLLAVFAGPLARLSTRTVAGAVIVLATWFGAGSFVMNRVWRTEESFWAQSVKKGGTALAHMNYARALQSRDPAAAEEHYQAALLREPDHVYARINLGLFRLSQGHAAEGLAELQRAATIRPDWGLVYFYLSEGYGQVGRREDAARASAHAAALDPRNPEYLYKAAWDAQAAGHVAQSLPFLEQLAALAPGYKDALFLEGFANQDTRPDRSIELYERFLASNPDHFQAHFNLGYARMRRGDFGSAVRSFQRALELRPSYASCHYYLAECYDRLGDSATAAAERKLYDEARGGAGG